MQSVSVSERCVRTFINCYKINILQFSGMFFALTFLFFCCKMHFACMFCPFSVHPVVACSASASEKRGLQARKIRLRQFQKVFPLGDIAEPVRIG